MKRLLVLGLLVLAGVGCSQKEESQVASSPVDPACLQYGRADGSRCSGYNYQQYGGNEYNRWSTYNYYGNGGYSYNNTYGGCSPGYAPVYSPQGLACYAIQSNVNYYYWQGQVGYGYGGYGGFLIPCDPYYPCPAGLFCSTGYIGAGVCVQ